MSLDVPDKMKATVFYLLLSDSIPNRELTIKGYFPKAIEAEPQRAKQFQSLCSFLLSVQDPEFAWLESILCDALRLAANHVDDGDCFAAFLKNKLVSNEVIVQTVRAKMSKGMLSMREAIAKETLPMLHTQDFWTNDHFVPLVRNVGQFDFDNTFVFAVFGVLEAFKPFFNVEKSKEIHEKVNKLIGLTKMWMHENQKKLIPRKRILLNALYERIVEKRANLLMTGVLSLVEPEILRGLLSPIPAENVPLVARELISWTYNCVNCSLLLPPIIKMLQRMKEEDMLFEYNQLALNNCNKMLGTLHLQVFRPLCSIVCHFLTNTTCPERVLVSAAENLKLIFVKMLPHDSVIHNLNKALSGIHEDHPELRDIIVTIMKDGPLQIIDSNANFTVNEEPKGLVNTGNTCYANSVIQCLFYITQFRNKALTVKARPSQNALVQLQKIFALLKFSSSTSILPDEIFHTTLRPSYFVKGHQEDGFLYLIHILDILKEQELKAYDIKDDELEVKKDQYPSNGSVKSEVLSETSNEDSKSDIVSNGEVVDELEEMSTSPDEPSDASSFASVKLDPETCGEKDFSKEVTNNNIPDEEEEDSNASEDIANAYQTISQEHFGGYQAETYCCHGCRYKHKQKKRTTAICLAIPDEGPEPSRISELMDAYFKPVELQDSEKYECRNCKAKVDSTCFTELISPPPYLILCLKRFLYNKSLQQTLKIMTQVQIEEEISVKGWDFRIHAMVVHSGSSASHGHYYSVINTENGKLKLDDVSVTTNVGCSPGHLDTPYILFYQRKDYQAQADSLNFDSLDASLQAVVRNYRRNTYYNPTSSSFKRPQPPPPPPGPSSSCGGGSGISSNRMVF